ncbi:MAG: metallophosphoesterase [Planctomycetaceae bacterium]|jgi:predicted MPP superfamily phosphohydrolase|nr:metallophosphoesterase [Planctomycetaceae bacterium]
MDTLPFHAFVFALDVIVLLGLFLWLRYRQYRRFVPQSSDDILRFALYHQPEDIRKPSLLWDLSGVVLFGGFWIACFAVFSRLIFTDYFQKQIFNFNVGQCIVEGLAFHGTALLLFTGILLCRNRRFVFAAIPLFFAAVLAGFSFDVLYREPYMLKVEHYEIKTSKVKKKLRVVFVADIQTDRIGWYEERTLQKIQQQKADLIILGGDYLQAYAGTPGVNDLPELFRQLLLRIPLKAPLGVFAIAGNVGPTDQKMFKDTGVGVVTSSTIFDNLGADKGLGPIDLVLLGLGDSDGGIGERGLTDSGNFIIMAGHYPNYAVDGYESHTWNHKVDGYRKAKRAPDLMLAGHTHGGQISLPWGEVLFTEGGDNHIKQLPRNMWKGFFTYPNGGHLLITRGSGMERGWAPRVRFLCPSEISVIDIVPE